MDIQAECQSGRTVQFCSTRRDSWRKGILKNPELKLDLDSITFNVPSSVICLPRLKYLRLNEVRLEDGESTEKLLSSPLLEELIINECYWYFEESIQVCVCSPKLQVLKIYDLYEEMSTTGDYHRAKICIIGDNLKHFCYIGNLINEYQICASSAMQLSKVEIYVRDEEIPPEDYALNCYKILKGLSGTQNLALSDCFLEGLQSYSERLDTIPIFESVTRLDIRVYKELCINSLALMKVYERCPRLDYLNVGKLSHAVGSPPLSPIPLCFQTHLKKILVHYYVPGDEADAAIDVLLNSAFVLKELVIYCKRDEGKGFHEGGLKFQELQDRLNRRPRVSKHCIISVRDTYYIERSVSSRWDHYGIRYLEIVGSNFDYYGKCYVNTINEL